VTGAGFNVQKLAFALALFANRFWKRKSNPEVQWNNEHLALSLETKFKGGSCVC
jgi:hypothetical protein